MPDLQQLFENNRAWADNITRQDPTFFSELAKNQSPSYLWVGCADSRVPASEITGLEPGELFVHRNIANVIVHTDLNALSTIQFAVEVLKVPHVIVCGHYGCGGVKAALSDANHGLIDNWLRHIQIVRAQYQTELDALATDAERYQRLCELNVIEQVKNLAATTVIRQAWKRGQRLTVHGLIYGLEDGLLRDLDVSVCG